MGAEVVSTPKYVPITELDPLMNDIEAELRHYFVPILGLSENKTEPLTPLGSGTLVEIGGAHYILTAAHVWHEAKDAERVGLVLDDVHSFFPMPRNTIMERECWIKGHWGPDLALLEIPLPSVSRIKAHKSFLNLPNQRTVLASDPANTDTGYWAITGMVGAWNKLRSFPEKRIVEADIQGRAFFTGIDRAYERDGWDYLEPSAKLDLPGVPHTFGGVSGGGLWEIRLGMQKSGEISWDKKRRFRGVAFRESDVSPDGRRTIRCHGPRSIFEKAWKEWGLPG